MRADEKFMMNIIQENILEKEYINYSVFEGADPPDYHVEVDGIRIGIELTQCKPIMIDNSELVETESFYKSIEFFVNQLNTEYGDKIDSNKCLLLNISYPIKKWSKVKKELRNSIERTLDDSFNNQLNGTFEICDEKIKWWYHDRPYGKRITAIINTKLSNGVYNIESHTKLLLINAINIKNKKVSSLSNSQYDQLWLGLYNDYFLSDIETYIEILNSLDIENRFDKIIIMDSNGNISTFNTFNCV